MRANASRLQEPMRIGEIVDRSFREAVALIKKIIVPLAVLSLVGGLSQAFADEQNAKLYPVIFGIGLLLGLVSRVMSAMYSYFIILASGEIWEGGDVDPRATFDRLRFKTFLRSIGLVFRVGIAGGLLFLLFIIPGLIYFMNRSLAFYILLLEDASISEACARSKFLMTQGKWYQLDGPWMRLSGLWAIILLLFMVSFLPMVLLGVLSAMTTQAGIVGVLLTGIIISLICFITFAVNLFSSISTVGFYYDLRVRYEGADLMSALDQVGSTSPRTASLSEPMSVQPNSPNLPPSW